MNYLQLLILSAIAAIAQATTTLLMAEPASADSPMATVLRVRDRDRPATTLNEWLTQLQKTKQETSSESSVKVTGVKLDRTDTGLDITLETADGKPLQVDATKFRTEGNSLIADIPNAILTLPTAQEFSADNPTTEIATVQVTQLDTNSIRVSVAGKTAPPTQEVTLRTGNLSYSLNPEGDEPDEEIVVTGDRRPTYRVPNASTATKTDTPLRDIPQSIQIIPQQLLRDRQATDLLQGLENASGVIGNTYSQFTRGSVVIRGFVASGTNYLINGIPDNQASTDSGFANVERLEVLKGPASVLFGEGVLSGTVNIVTKQPLQDPFYEATFSAGSFRDYRGAIDLSGPLNDSKTVLYRFNASYRNYESFLDFHKGNALFFAPNLKFVLGSNTTLTVEGDINIGEQNAQSPEGQPAVGTVLPNPNGQLRRNLNLAGPQADNLTVVYRAGYRFEHKFNDNLTLRNSFLAAFYDDDDRGSLLFSVNNSLARDNRTLNRRYFEGSQYYANYNLITDLISKFQTGAIEHQVLVGFSLRRYTAELNSAIANAVPIDIFNPVFNQTRGRPFDTFTDSFTTRDTLGIYLQDQIKLAENLKLLLGGRIDFFQERATNRLRNLETEQSDTAFSPRVGIVYQPIEAISLYANFARSFTPTIGISASGDPFQPGRGTQYEVGIKADLSSRLAATIALYDLTRTNVTTTDINNPFFSVQTGEQRSRGVEFDISGEILPGWNIVAGYAYNIAEVTADNTIRVGNRLNNAPEHSFNLWTTYRIQSGFLKGLGFGLGFYYVGDRQGDLANTFTLPSYFRTDMALFYERDLLRVALNFRNLFNAEYYELAQHNARVFPGAPLTVQGTISWQF